MEKTLNDLVNDWANISIGSNWKNKNTGRVCIVTKPPRHRNDDVHLLHQSGRSTKKQLHYFLYDFVRIV